MMEANRWQTVQRVFEEAVEQPTADREAFAEDACGGDRQVLEEVMSLLQADAEAGQRIEQAVEGGEGLLWGGSQDKAAEGPRFGKYEVKARIGEGGFGTVYRGRDPVLRRSVAIKTCARPDAAMRRRFFREAQIAAGLQHSNIVTVHELGVEGGVPFLVQELLGGSDLRELIEAGAPLTLSQRLDILLQVARGLAHAHQAGVLHRDVKPANIRVLEDGGVKMLDFGIAKLLDAESQLTGTGTTLGTVGYLAPEQLKSEPIDERADVFAFGVVAYELLTGVRPFEGESFSQVSYQLLYVDPEPLESRWPECPPRLANLVYQCLEKEPEDRIRDFVAVIAELEPLLEELDPGSAALRALPLPPPKVSPPTESFSSAEAPTLRLPKPPKRKRWQIAAGVVVVSFFAAALYLQAPNPEPSPADYVPVETSSDLESTPEQALTPEPVSDEPALPSTPPPSTPVQESAPPPSEPVRQQEPPPPPTQPEPQPTAESTPVEPRESIESTPATDPPPAEPTQEEPLDESQLTEPSTPVEPSPAEATEPPVPAVVEEEPPPAVEEVTSTPEPPAEPASPTVRRGDLFTAGPGVKPPRLLEQPHPEYPRRARRRGKEARVVVKVLVDEEGKVLQAIAPGDKDGFGEAARAAALKARFEPATQDGIAGKMWRNLPFEFKVQ